MGLLDSLATWLGLKQRQAKVICVGLDNSGKSTIINHLKPESVSAYAVYSLSLLLIISHLCCCHMQTKAHNVVPTIGFNVEVFKHDR